MRRSLGATRRERVLAENPWRQVVLVNDPEGFRVVRRISATSAEGPDLVDRAGALGLVRQLRMPGFALIEDRAIVGSTLEIAEAFIDGFTIRSALDAIRARISVTVAISIVHDLAKGLSVLQSVVEPTGRPANLVHGRLELDQLMLVPSGDVFAIGLEGARGEAPADVADLLKVLHSLLVSKANTKAGSGLLARLAQLKFDSADQMSQALAAYLQRQNDDEVHVKRRALAAEVAEAIAWKSPRLDFQIDPADLAEETPAASPEGRTEIGSKLGTSGAVEMDEDGDGPTVTDQLSLVERVDATPDPLPARIDRKARDGVLGPAVPPKVEKTKERSVSIGDYRVVASIGRGGMGEIYLARAGGKKHTGLVALKVLGPDDSGDDEALGMFIDEASIMAQIDHPNVLKIIDFGHSKGRHFLAMEYLEGRPLVRVMIDAYQNGAGLDYGVIASIGADAARGLFAAHMATTPQGVPLKIVHRDVSPQNIFITYPGITKVIDFGVARAAQRVSKTAVGIVKGKAAYMSPEQTEGREVDARSDVFSLGTCLWEMTAGRRLFKRETEYDTLVAVATSTVERPTEVRGQPDPVLDRVILNALHRNREKRTPSALELGAQLTDYARGIGIRDGRAAISQVMHRLFGKIAAEEQALIASLEARAATADEVDSLRRLSGVSPRKSARKEITLVAEPSGILELDDFGASDPETSVPPNFEPEAEAEPQFQAGEDTPRVDGALDIADPALATVPGPGRRPAADSTAGPTHVAPPAAPPPGAPASPLSSLASTPPPEASRPAPASGRALNGASRGVLTNRATPLVDGPRAVSVASTLVIPNAPPPPSAEPPPPVTPGIDASDSAVQLIDLDDGDFEVLGSAPNEAPLGFDQVRDGARHDARDEARDSLLDAVLDRPPKPTSAAPAAVLARIAVKRPDFTAADGSLTAKHPTHARFGRRALFFGGGALAAALVVVLVLARSDRSEPTRSAVALPAEGSARVAGAQGQEPGGGALAAARETAKTALDPQAAGGGTTSSTTAASVEMLLEDLERRGFGSSASERTLLLDDGHGQTVVVDRGARVVHLTGGRGEGWLVTNEARGLRQVVWIGALDGGPWFARSLSVNDCGATGEATPTGVKLHYRDQTIDLPLGGGTLLDVSLERPAFATRLEIAPLGLAFGQKDDSSAALWCAAGWWGRQVVLRSLPEGRYSLTWVGPGVRETAELEALKASVKGGTLVHTSSTAL